MMKRVVVFLKSGTVASEDMTEEEAQAELDRILEEKPGLNEREVIRVGKTGAFRSGDFVQIQIQDPPKRPVRRLDATESSSPRRGPSA